MSRRIENATSDYLQVDSAPVTGVPLTMSCWFSGLTGILMGLYDASDTTRPFALEIVSGDHRVYAGSLNSRAMTTTTYTEGKWHHACGVFTSATLRAAYLDGGGEGTNTVNRVPSGIDRVTIGRHGDFTPSPSCTAKIYDAAIWNAALTIAEQMLLARGHRASEIRPQNLVFNPRFDDHRDIDYVGRLGLTAFGSPGLYSNPPMIEPVRRVYSVPAAVAFVPYPRPRGLRAGLHTMSGGLV